MSIKLMCFLSIVLGAISEIGYVFSRDDEPDFGRFIFLSVGAFVFGWIGIFVIRGLL